MAAQPDSTGEEAPERDAPPRYARWLGGFLLLALVVPGLRGIELWPLTGWKMFSLPRGDTGSAWVLQGVDEAGDSHLVDLEELPVAYSNAEWQLREMGGASEGRREEICQALAAPVAEVDPTIVELRIARDSRQLVEEDDGWGVDHDLDVRYSCVPEAAADGDETGAGPVGGEATGSIGDEPGEDGR